MVFQRNYKKFFTFTTAACASATFATSFILPNPIKDEPTLNIPQKEPNLLETRQLLPNENAQIFQSQLKQAQEAVHRHMTITGSPGMSIGVSRNGKTIWQEGFGFADVETGAKCTGQSVMRIASISKPITATVAGRLVERGLLDLDKSIHEYLSEEEFPKKTINGKSVTITARQLLSHTSGVRHYPKKDELAPDSVDLVEFASNRRFNSVNEALGMFKADPLLCAPGNEYHYTTHGYTLLSAVLQKAEGGRDFKDQLRELLRERLEMFNTHLDIAQEPVVAHRTRYYKRNGSNRLENVREVDNSYKIAGGGILSNVGDLLKFANAILHSYQSSPNLAQKPLLRPETIRQFWTKNAEHIAPDGKKLAEYGLGWTLAPPNGWDDRQSGKENATGKRQFEKRKYWFHTGGAVGASSVLLIKPSEPNNPDELPIPPHGLCVAILVNCQNCSCLSLAIELAQIFDNGQQ